MLNTIQEIKKCITNSCGNLPPLPSVISEAANGGVLSGVLKIFANITRKQLLQFPVKFAKISGTPTSARKNFYRGGDGSKIEVFKKEKIHYFFFVQKYQ